VVHYALLGDFDQLKERLIGMTLLGRDASYDTGSDAGVRVRANEVRKRLIACRATQPADAVFSFELPPGSYIPHFLRRSDPLSQSVCQSDQAIELDDRPPGPLSHQQLAMPTLIALFLCTMCLRWQVAQEHPFTAFWETIFQDRHATLYISPAYSDRGQELIAAQQFSTVAPLLNLAGQFHTRFKLASATVPPTATGDHGSSDSRRLAGRAALLTIANGNRRSIRIDGTDNAALGSLIDMLCARDSFPELLSDSLQQGTVTQVVFLFTQHPDIVVFHEPLSSAQAGATQTQ
jgi:hypothetical protein